MLGISYGELFLLLGAAVALIGPKDLPIIARTTGRLAGRAIGYVQVARCQFESVMQQSQARQVHKELQDTMAQLEAIRHEIRSISFMNPGPVTTRLVDNISKPTSVDKEPSRPPEEGTAVAEIPATTTIPPEEGIAVAEIPATTTMPKDHGSTTSSLCDIHSQAMTYAKMANSCSFGVKSLNEVLSELTDESGQFIVLPVSAESAGLLPNKKDDLRGSDILLEAILEADVAHNAKDFFAQAQSR